MESREIAQALTQYFKMTRDFPPGYEHWESTVPKAWDHRDYTLEHTARLVLACISKMEEGYQPCLAHPTDAHYTKVLRGTSSHPTLLLFRSVLKTRFGDVFRSRIWQQQPPQIPQEDGQVHGRRGQQGRQGFNPLHGAGDRGGGRRPLPRFSCCTAFGYGLPAQDGQPTGWRRAPRD